MSTTSPTGSLAERAAALRWAGLPADVRERALFAVQDALACAAGGSVTELARIHRTALGVCAGEQATVIGAGLRSAPAPAAYHNATATNAMDYDDTARHSGHPGSVVVSAALAVAEATKAAGITFLEAVVAGYEVALAVAAACRPSPAQYDLVHGSASFLAMGASVAAGRVLGLDAEGMARAIGIAGPLSPVPGAGKFGFDEPQLSWIKDNVSWPAEAGVRAALLAAAGFPASHGYLDGDKGFWRMVASDRFDPALIDAPGGYHVRDLGFKPYPCCRWLHAALDATAVALREGSPGAAADIGEIRIESTKAVAAIFGNRRPATMVDAQFSAPHAVAALVLGVPLVHWWRPEHRASAAVHGLMDRVHLVEDAELTRSFLKHGRNINRLPARVVIRFGDGRETSALCDHPMGTPGREGALEEERHFERKHRDLFGVLLDAPAVDAMIGAIAALPHAVTLDGVVRPLSAAGAAG